MPDISRAMKDLEYRPSALLAAGIAQTIEWIKSVYQVPGIARKTRGGSMIGG